MTTSKYAADYSAAFLTIWDAYPWKCKKGDAWKAFQQVHADQHVTLIMDALAWQIVQPRWTKEDGEYVPLLATYLRARSWEDEPFHVEPPKYRGWECPHTPKCEQRHYCALKTAKDTPALLDEKETR